MARSNPEGGHIIAAGEVGSYSVCPQAWYLSYVKREKASRMGNVNTNSIRGQDLHRDWSRFFEESLTFLTWFRYLAMLLCMMLVVFLTVNSHREPLYEVFKLSYRNLGLQLLVLVMICAWLMRVFDREARKRHEDSGFSRNEVALSIDSGSLLPEREYISTRQGLAGKPDALVQEGDIIIPVERKPLARKLRDRYVAQLLVYMRLVGEFEGRNPPHGYLLLGPNCRRVKVVNAAGKQAWVEELLNEMRAILNGAEPKPKPHPKKCAGCEVRERCKSRADLSDSNDS